MKKYQKMNGKSCCSEGKPVKTELFDVDVSDKTLRIRNTKFCVERLVPLGVVASQYLKTYLHEVRSCWCNNPAEKSLFLNARGMPLCPQPGKSLC